MSGASAQSSAVSFQQHMTEGLYQTVDVADELHVLRHVLTALPKVVTVYPSENYYYFSFWANGQKYTGNLRLSPHERDRGFVHFAYFKFNPDPKHPDDFESWYKLLGKEDGVHVSRLGDLRYSIEFQNDVVEFRLNSLSQEPPKEGFLREGERFLQRTWDESGIRFILTFSELTRSFHWSLDSENSYSLELEALAEDVAWDPMSGFVFYADPQLERRLLIGVSALNTKQNNYYDGPFDQLADNDMTKYPLGQWIEAAYPYTRNRVDSYGVFTDLKGSRVAITPYYSYDEPEELVELVDACRYRDADDFFACMNYDYKRDVPETVLESH